MDQADLISVIIPVYNSEKHLKTCVNSVINQTYRNLEIILVDDGSSDTSPKMCDEYAKQDKRIKVIHKENGGVSTARNVGIDAASGVYIGFVDSDDYIDLDMYEVLAKNAKAYNADISVVGCNVQQQNGSWVIRSAGFDNTKFFKGSEAMNYFIEYEFDLASMCDKLFKKTVIGELRLKTDMKMNEDVDFVYRCYRKCEGVSISDKSKYYYRYNQSSCTHKGSHSFDDMLICMDNIYLSEKKVGKRTDVLNRQFCKAMLANFNVCVIQNKRQWSVLKSYIQKFHKSLSYFAKDDYKDMSRKKRIQIKTIASLPTNYVCVHIYICFLNFKLLYQKIRYNR